MPAATEVRRGIPVKLRPATPDDLGLLRHWDQQPHVVASDPNDDWNWETELARSPDWREQLIAEIDGPSISGSARNRTSVAATARR